MKLEKCEEAKTGFKNVMIKCGGCNRIIEKPYVEDGEVIECPTCRWAYTIHKISYIKISHYNKWKERERGENDKKNNKHIC